jgi:phosphoglycolate phosphatase
MSSTPRPVPRQYDLIVFDWDGTLFDSTALIVDCIQAACRDLGAPVPDRQQSREVIGLSLDLALRQASPGLADALYPQLCDRYRHHYFRDHHEVTLFDGVPELLRQLRSRHHWLAVATGKSRRGLDEALQISGLRPLFDATRTADETASKPNPLMLIELMREFGTDAERTLMIGDTTHDLQLAANAGVDSLAVTYGAHEAEVLLCAHSPKGVAHTVLELQAWLETHA